jgi:hypothetical protein
VRLRFGDWVFDAESRELLGPEGAAHLSPKAFDLLGVLLENRPRALAKAELRGRGLSGLRAPDLLHGLGDRRHADLLGARTRLLIAGTTFRKTPRFPHDFPGAPP